MRDSAAISVPVYYLRASLDQAPPLWLWLDQGLMAAQQLYTRWRSKLIQISADERAGCEFRLLRPGKT